MILFGAGSSVPFDIPGMAGFTTQFIEGNKDVSDFILNIEGAITKSEEMVGIPFNFDLETLLSVLNDLSGTKEEKAITIPTVCLLLKEKMNITSAREKYGDMASSTLDELRVFVFETCMQPIKKGREEGNFEFLDHFYGPLMTVLNNTGLANIQGPLKKIYSTNWDLCFKTWADYTNIPVHDGTSIDKQSFPYLNAEEFTASRGDGFDYIPLHGSLDFIKVYRPKGGGIYKDISKISEPIRYFEEKPANIKDIFMIYPLEAIGYEESIKSPYLDMLNAFRTSLRMESTIFIIGYSLRDPTIGSVIEEVIAQRIRQGDLNLLSDDLDSRKIQAREHRLKIIVINPHPDRLVENLRKQFRTNLLQTFVPVRIEFPKIADEDFNERYTQILRKLIEHLGATGYMGPAHKKPVIDELQSRYDISLG